MAGTQEVHMTELIVLAFNSEQGAQTALAELVQLQKQELIKLSDAATVVRKSDGKVKVKQAVDLVGAGALGGAFWGMLIGLIFLVPWLGLAIGAISGAIAGRFSDIGIDDKFIKEVGTTVEPGHSALFLMVERMTEDRVLPQLQKFHPTVLRTNLSTEDEEKLKAAFGASE
jgi:uncharacterized membrane protein